jgi:hypothetical protein
MRNFGITELNGSMMINTETSLVSYIIYEIEEPITKKMLNKIKSELGGGYTLVTNAGVDLHSSEVVDNMWNEIRILRHTSTSSYH